MALGSGIALIVLGAIMAFALDLDVDGVDFDLIGYICMGAGVLAIILSLVLSGQKSRAIRDSGSTTVTTTEP